MRNIIPSHFFEPEVSMESTGNLKLSLSGSLAFLIA